MATQEEINKEMQNAINELRNDPELKPIIEEAEKKAAAYKQWGIDFLDDVLKDANGNGAEVLHIIMHKIHLVAQVMNTSLESIDKCPPLGRALVVKNPVIRLAAKRVNAELTKTRQLFTRLEII